jgi:hypothetical protein
MTRKLILNFNSGLHTEEQLFVMVISISQGKFMFAKLPE